MANKLSRNKILECLQNKKIEPLIVQVGQLQPIEKQPNVFRSRVHDGVSSVTVLFRLKSADKMKTLKANNLIKITQGSVHIPENADKQVVFAVGDFEMIDATITHPLAETLQKIDKPIHVQELAKPLPSVSKNRPVSHVDAIPQDLSKSKICALSMLTATNGRNATIKVRVLSKSDKLPYSGGNFFNFIVQDREGAQLKITCWNDTCNDKFDVITVGETYYICKGSFKESYGKGIRNARQIDLDMSVNKNTMIQKSEDQVQLISSIVPIADLDTAAVDSSYDICALLLKIEEETTTKNGHRKQIGKFIDQSNYCVEMQFWNDACDKLTSMVEGTIYVLKNVTLKEYRYKYLEWKKSSEALEGLDIEQFDEFGYVKKFIAARMNEDGTTSFDGMQYLSETTRGEQSMSNTNQQEKSPLMSLKALNEKMESIAETASESLKQPFKANVYGYFSAFKIDTGFCYVSCPECKKKVDDSSYCSKCQREVEPVRRYLTRVSISDSTSTIWLTLFDEDMKKVTRGITADQMTELNEEDPSKCEEAFNQLTHVQYRFHVVCNVEYYQDKYRPRYTCNFLTCIDDITDEANKSVIRKALDLKEYLLPETN